MHRFRSAGLRHRVERPCARQIRILRMLKGAALEPIRDNNDNNSVPTDASYPLNCRGHRPSANSCTLLVETVGGRDSTFCLAREKRGIGNTLAAGARSSLVLCYSQLNAVGRASLRKGIAWITSQPGLRAERIDLGITCRLAIVQGDQFGDAGGTLAALDLDHEMIVHAQAVWRHVFRFCNRHAAAQP